MYVLGGGDITRIEDFRKIISHQIDVVFHSASYGMSGREQVNMMYLLSECLGQNNIYLARGCGFIDVQCSVFRVL